MRTPSLLRATLLGCLTAVTLSSAAVAQVVQPLPPVTEPVPPLPPDALCYEGRLLLKFKDGAGAILEDQWLGSRTGAQIGTLNWTLLDHSASIERAIDIPLETLDEWHRHADEVLPPGAMRPGHLGLWFRIEVSDYHRESLLAALRAHPWVQEVDRELIPLLGSVPRAELDPPPVHPDDIPPQTPDLSGTQTYGQDAPSGFGFDRARRITGARGQVLTMYHAEVEWYVDHEDLRSVTAGSFITGRDLDASLSYWEHGTAVLGAWIGSRNGFGVTGVVDAARVKLSSWGPTGLLSTSITAVIDDAKPGNVLCLLTQYDIRQVKEGDFVPAEYARIDFDAIRTAVTRGIVVVEIAGNGDNDLDDDRFARRFDPSTRDSGAIMVAATAGADPERAFFSNYGSRVDANGWGDDVATTGHGTSFNVPGDPLQRYTERAAGTSAAATVVAAAVGQIMSAVAYQNNYRMSPDEMRNLLRTQGTVVGDQIGLRTDVPKALASMGLPDGLDVDSQVVPLGGEIRIELSGEAGTTAVPMLGIRAFQADIGVNRPLLLDPTEVWSLGAFAMDGTPRTLIMQVPYLPLMHGLDIFLQSVRLEGDDYILSSGAEIHLVDTGAGS